MDSTMLFITLLGGGQPSFMTKNAVTVSFFPSESDVGEYLLAIMLTDTGTPALQTIYYWKITVLEKEETNDQEDGKEEEMPPKPDEPIITESTLKATLIKVDMTGKATIEFNEEVFEISNSTLLDESLEPILKKGNEDISDKITKLEVETFTYRTMVVKITFLNSLEISVMVSSLLLIVLGL